MALLPMISTSREHQLSGLSSGAWPGANLIIYAPVRIKEDCTALRAFWTNGSSVSGNVNFGLYSSTGSKQWETGSTAQSGTNQTQFVDIADQAVSAGLYYFALQLSGTQSIPRQNPGLYYLIASGVMQEAAGSFALPTTATFAALATAYLPVCGLDLRGAP